MSTLKKRTRAGAALAAVASAASIFALTAPAQAAAVAPDQPILPVAPAPALSFVDTCKVKADWQAAPTGEPATSFIVSSWPTPRVDDPYGVPVGLQQFVVAAPTTELIITGLTSGTSYNVTVAANNAYGSSSDLVLGLTGAVPACPPHDAPDAHPRHQP